jgi:purine-nucleoside phosphorylase
MLKKIQETADFIRTKTNVKPVAGIILGTGLSGLGKEIVPDVILDYKDIPHFPVSTVTGHQGRLIIGKLGNKDVVAMQGRFHFYEGYDMGQLVFPTGYEKPRNQPSVCFQCQRWCEPGF